MKIAECAYCGTIYDVHQDGYTCPGCGSNNLGSLASAPSLIVTGKMKREIDEELLTAGVISLGEGQGFTFGGMPVIEAPPGSLDDNKIYMINGKGAGTTMNYASMREAVEKLPGSKLRVDGKVIDVIYHKLKDRISAYVTASESFYSLRKEYSMRFHDLEYRCHKLEEKVDFMMRAIVVLILVLAGWLVSRVVF